MLQKVNIKRITQRLQKVNFKLIIQLLNNLIVTKMENKQNKRTMKIMNRVNSNIRMVINIIQIIQINKINRINRMNNKNNKFRIQISLTKICKMRKRKKIQPKQMGKFKTKIQMNQQKLIMKLIIKLSKNLIYQMKKTNHLDFKDIGKNKQKNSIIGIEVYLWLILILDSKEDSISSEEILNKLKRMLILKILIKQIMKRKIRLINKTKLLLKN